MSPSEIESFGRAFKLGVAAERERTRALLDQARALECEIAAIKAEYCQLRVLALGEPGQPVHWSWH